MCIFQCSDTFLFASTKHEMVPLAKGEKLVQEKLSQLKRLLERNESRKLAEIQQRSIKLAALESDLAKSVEEAAQLKKFLCNLEHLVNIKAPESVFTEPALDIVFSSPQVRGWEADDAAAAAAAVAVQLQINVTK
jgi:hypothetical protein